MADIREDNLDAYRWILNDMNKAIGEELDTRKIAVLGWSAGGTSLLYLVSPLPPCIDTVQHTHSRKKKTQIQAHDAQEANLPAPTCLIPTYPKVEMNSDKEKPISALKETCSEEEWAAVEKLKAEPVCTGYRHG